MRKKILTMLIGFSAIPIIIITAIILTSNTKAIQTLHINRLKSVADTSASAFTEIVGMRKDELNLLASSWGIRDYLNALQKEDISSANNALTDINEYFRTYVDSLKTFDDIVLLDSDGIVLTGYHSETIGMDLSSMDYYQEVCNNTDEGFVFNSKVHNSLTAPDDPDKKSLALSTTFWTSDQQLLGVLVAFADINILAEFARKIYFGETGLSFVIDADNYILYHPEARFYNSHTTAPALDNLMFRYRNGEIPQSDIIYTTMDGTPRIYYYEVMDENQLILILRQEYSEFIHDQHEAVVIGVVTAAIILVLAVLMGLSLSNSFVKPIRKLKSSFASSASSGDYVICDLKRNDELGEMAESYNTMIQTLENQYRLLKEEKEKNEYSSLHNKTTKLYNRYAFEQELSRQLALEIPYSIFFIDIDNFKLINDIYGRPSGDILLLKFAARLASSAVKFDICSHLGGDEFILAKTGRPEEMKDAAVLLYEELSKPYHISGGSVGITISCGISSYPEHGISAETLITNADIAMYEAKNSGKDTFCFYTNEMRVSLDRYNSIIQTLRTCIEHNEVFMMYQPIYTGKTNKVEGFEALMRIKSKEFGLISPVEFIPIAEYEKLTMIKLGTWALQTTIHYVRHLIDTENFSGYVSVNISSVQLYEDGFENTVIKLLEDAMVPASFLQLEITRGDYEDRTDIYTKKLTVLHDYGISIALDDFSTHQAWYHSLTHLPIDVVKIDQPFFADVDTDEHVAHMNKSIIELIHQFGLKVVAEGVETQAIYDIMSMYGCDSIQGFLLSQPLMERAASTTK